MTLPVWMQNLIAYSLQIAVLAAAGTLLAFVFRLRVPRVALVYWQVLLLACLLVFALQEWRHPVLTQAPAVAAAVSPVVPSSPAVVVAPPAFRMKPEWIGYGIVAGVLLRLIWFGIGFLRLVFFRRNAHCPAEELSGLKEAQTRTGVRASVLFSDRVDTPVTFGLRNPIIILPARFMEMSDDCRRAVLCHELLHIRRRDWLFILIEEAVRSLFWFHPAIWWLLGRIRLAREQTVDCEVVRLAGERQPYLNSLLEFARAPRRPNAVPAPLFLSERHLVQRVALLLKGVSMTRSRIILSLAAICTLLAATVRISAAWFPLTGAPVSALEVRSSEAVLQSGPGPIKVSGDVQERKLIRRVEPIYPELAKRARVAGRVVLLVTTDEEGFVSDIQVVSGHPLLNEAAVEAVRQWRYSETLLNGKPVPVSFTVTCIFNLRGDDGVLRGDDGVIPPTRDRSETTVEITVAEAPAPARVVQSGERTAQSGREPIKVGGNVQESKLIQRVEPVYPELAKRARIVGKVTLVVTVNEEGFVSDVRVTSGHPLLNEAAVEAVRQWRYSPTLLNGEPVPVMTTVTCVFSFMDKDDVMLSLDESGALKGYGFSTAPAEELIRNLPQGGTAHLSIAAALPVREAEKIVQDLLRKGIRLIVSGAYNLYDGKLFYVTRPTRGPQFAFDLAKLNGLFEASQAEADRGRATMLRYNIYLNEVGEIVGVQRQYGPDNPEIDRELMRTPVIGPAFLGPDPIPYMYVFELMTSASSPTSARLSGTVADTSQSGLPGTKVTAKSVETGVSTSVMSNSAGVYNLIGLQAGTYRVTAELAGFQPQTFAGVKIVPTAQVRINFTLTR